MATTQLKLIRGLGFLGLVSIVCQGVGLFYPAWMTFSMSIDIDKLERTSGVDLTGAQDMSMDVNMGLWTINACYETPNEYNKQCGSVSTTELQNIMSSRDSTLNSPGDDKLFGDWLIFQVLALAAAFFATVGFGAIVRLARATEDNLRFHGCITLFTWMFSAGFILIAVGKRANDNSTYATGTDVINELNLGVLMKFHTPWAIVASGIGGVLAGILGSAITMYLVCRHPSSPAETNMAVMNVEMQPVQIALLDRKTNSSDWSAEKPMLIPTQPMAPPKYSP